jgi:hypothetical protein
VKKHYFDFEDVCALSVSDLSAISVSIYIGTQKSRISNVILPRGSESPKIPNIVEEFQMFILLNIV